MHSRHRERVTGSIYGWMRVSRQRRKCDPGERPPAQATVQIDAGGARLQTRTSCVVVRDQGKASEADVFRLDRLTDGRRSFTGHRNRTWGQARRDRWPASYRRSSSTVPLQKRLGSGAPFSISRPVVHGVACCYESTGRSSTSRPRLACCTPPLQGHHASLLTADAAPP
jgi:hypothetical protein